MSKVSSAAFCSVVFVAALFVGSVAMADVRTQGAAQPAKPAQKLSRKQMNKINGLECKRVRETGSRVSKKVCTTAAQREAASRRERDKVNALEDRAILTSPSSS